MISRKEENLTMLFDFYEMTMANGYYLNGMADTTAYFDVFFRKNPDDAGFSIFAGLGTIIDYLNNLHFSEEDIRFLKGKGIFNEDFLDSLRHFHFSCDVWAVPEGSLIFPYEPVITVRGPIVQATLLETMLLLCFNHQSLIATKTSRIVRAADGRPVMEFGSRRAQGPDAATMGAKAAYIGGAAGTADTLADEEFGVPAMGTMAHSWVEMFPDEFSAFAAYARAYPTNCVLLVDTYDTLSSGVPNAIKTFQEVLLPMGYRPGGIRLDSGDQAYLTKQARKMLDKAGFPDATIVSSNSLDEYKILDFAQQGAKINSFGVGENLITSASEPVFGGVYKLAAIEDKEGNIIPKIKISENVEKITNPGFKHFYRFYDKKHEKAMADLITLADEKLDDSQPIEIFHPIYTWKTTTLEDYILRPMHERIFDHGKLVYQQPSLKEIRSYCQKEVDSLWSEYRRFQNPSEYKVDLSKPLWSLKHQLLNEARSRIEESKMK